jgi:hypothetical protein
MTKSEILDECTRLIAVIKTSRVQSEEFWDRVLKVDRLAEAAGITPEEINVHH